MSLHFLLGAAGCGKSTKMIREIIRRAEENPARHHIVLVPEQFTMQTQRRLVLAHPRHALLNIDVLSFERMAHRVFRELSLADTPILDEIGVSMLLRLAVDDCRKELHIFKKRADRPGFIKKLQAMISELQQYDIGAEALEAMAGHEEITPLLREKLREISIIFRAFRERLGSGRMTPEALLPALLRVLPRSRQFDGVCVWLDCFTGFTGVQYGILTQLLRRCSEMTIALTLPAGEYEKKARRHELFWLSHDTLRRMRDCAAQTGHDDAVTFVPDREDVPRELMTLRGNILRYSHESSDIAPARISMTFCANPADEADFLAEKIRELVRDGSCRYRDIAVVTGDLQTYLPYLEKRFAEADIPFFSDKRKSLEGHALLRMLDDACRIAFGDGERGLVIRYLRSNLTGISRDETDLLENYCIAAGRLRAGQWEKAWRGTAGLYDEQELALLNELRLRVMEPLLGFRERLRAVCSPESFREAVLIFIENLGCEQQLAGQNEELRRQGREHQADIGESVFGKLTELLDKMCSLLSDRPLSCGQYADLMVAGFSQLSLGLIPAGLDAVTIGDVERSRLGDIKVLLLPGLNEGSIPRAGAAGAGLLTESERSLLHTLDIELAPTEETVALHERFYLYNLFAKPTQALVMSFSAMSRTGERLRASLLIEEILRIFPAARVNRRGDAGPDRCIPGKRAAERLLADSLAKGREEPERWADLYRYLVQAGGCAERVDKMIDGATARYEDEPLPQAQALRLYGHKLHGSVTRLERYASCAYKHFLLHGLSLQERKEAELGAPDRGTFFHRALEYALQQVRDAGKELSVLTGEERRSLAQAAAGRAAEELEQTVLGQKAAYAYYIDRWKKVIDRSLWAMGEQLKTSPYVPSFFEMKFLAGEDSTLRCKLPGGDMVLRGIIDRVDLFRQEDDIYVRVIDYKTSPHGFDATDFYHGLALQLTVYLAAAVEKVQRLYPKCRVHPAGMYYYNIDDPIVRAEGGMRAEAVESLLLKQLRLTGISAASGKGSGAADKQISERLLEEMLAHMRRNLSVFGAEVLDGKISVNPYYRKSEKNGCSYCEFKAVCGFDRSVSGFSYRHLAEIKLDALEDILEQRERREPDGSHMDDGAKSGH